MADKYKHVESGEWFRVAKREHRNACCDCGLVHVVDYRIVRDDLDHPGDVIEVEGMIEMRVRRDGPATGGMRRAMKRKKKPRGR